MKMKHRIIIFTILCLVFTVSLCGCSSPSFFKKSSSGIEQEGNENNDTNFIVATNVSYSSGSDGNWSYGNQRKEFPQDKACYCRISSNVVAEKSRGVGTEIVVTYKFTGASDCNIELSDGIATEVESNDSNVVIFERTIIAEKEKNAAESIVIFRYTPNYIADSVALEVIYDDHVPERYDVRNTIYFNIMD